MSHFPWCVSPGSCKSVTDEEPAATHGVQTVGHDLPTAAFGPWVPAVWLAMFSGVAARFMKDIP